MNARSKSCITSDHSCVNCLKKEYSLFSDLSQDHLERLNKNRFEVNFSAGECIYKQGMRPEYLICLNSGKVKITKLTSTGKMQIIGLNQKVDFLGLSDLVSNRLYTTSGIALENCSACFIPKTQLDQVIEINPDFARRIIELFAQQIQNANTRLTSHTQKHLRGRLADTLLYIYDAYGYQDNTHLLDVQLKRSDIAELSSMDVSNASRSLSEFMEEGIIALHGRKIELLDIARLNSISKRG